MHSSGYAQNAHAVSQAGNVRSSFEQHTIMEDAGSDDSSSTIIAQQSARDVLVGKLRTFRHGADQIEIAKKALAQAHNTLLSMDRRPMVSHPWLRAHVNAIRRRANKLASLDMMTNYNAATRDQSTPSKRQLNKVERKGFYGALCGQSQMEHLYSFEEFEVFLGAWDAGKRRQAYRETMSKGPKMSDTRVNAYMHMMKLVLAAKAGGDPVSLLVGLQIKLMDLEWDVSEAETAEVYSKIVKAIAMSFDDFTAALGLIDVDESEVDDILWPQLERHRQHTFVAAALPDFGRIPTEDVQRTLNLSDENLALDTLGIRFWHEDYCRKGGEATFEEFRAFFDLLKQDQLEFLMQKLDAGELAEVGWGDLITGGEALWEDEVVEDEACRTQ